MKRFLIAILFLCGLGAVDLSWSQDTEPAEVARIVGSKKVKDLDKHIRSLSKRISNGLKTGTLTQQKADELNAEVQAIWDKKKGFMAETGAQKLTDVQFKELRKMWKETLHKIPRLKYPAGHIDRFPVGDAK